MATVLCIDDEPDILEDVVELVESAGHTAIQANNGNEGLKMILSQEPQLVICDITMPEKDGKQLLAEVRKNYPKFANMPIIFLSALSDQEDVLTGLDLGADDYLTKPIDLKLLKTKITANLRQVDRMKEANDREIARLFRSLSEDLPSDGNAFPPPPGTQNEPSETPAPAPPPQPAVEEAPAAASVPAHEDEAAPQTGIIADPHDLESSSAAAALQLVNSLKSSGSRLQALGFCDCNGSSQPIRAFDFDPSTKRKINDVISQLAGEHQMKANCLIDKLHLQWLGTEVKKIDRNHTVVVDVHYTTLHTEMHFLNYYDSFKAFIEKGHQSLLFNILDVPLPITAHRVQGLLKPFGRRAQRRTVQIGSNDFATYAGSPFPVPAVLWEYTDAAAQRLDATLVEQLKAGKDNARVLVIARGVPSIEAMYDLIAYGFDGYAICED